MYKIFRKIVLIFSVILLSFSLSSCGYNLERPSGDTPDNSQTDSDSSSSGKKEELEKGFKYEFVNGKYYIKDAVFDSNLKYLEIPKKSYDGIDIVGIKANAFSRCSNLETLVLYDSIETIEEGALNNLGNLKSITVPFIGKENNDFHPFGYIFGTKEYVNSVKTRQDIKENDTYKLNYYYIPKNLSSVSILSQSEIFYSQFRNMKSLVYVDFPDNLEKIDDYAFAESGINRFDLKEDMVIANTAFNGCVLNGSVNYYQNGYYLGTQTNRYKMLIGIANLSSDYLTINESTEIIKNDLLNEFTNIKKLKIPYKIKDIEINIPKNLNLTEAQLTYKQYMDLTNRNSITSLILNDLDGYNGSYQFNDSLTNLTYFKFADGIDYNNFSNFDFINYLSNNVFRLNSNLYYIGTESNPYFMLAKSSNVSLCTINQNTVVLANYCLSNYSSFMTIPESVKYIGSYALINVSGVTINGIIDYCSPNNFYNVYSNYYTYDGLRYIGDASSNYKFLIGCYENKTSYTLHSDTEVIRSDALSYNDIFYIYLNDGLKEIGDYAFSNTKIYNLVLPNSIKNIGRNIVENCINFSGNHYDGGAYIGTKSNSYYYFYKPESISTRRINIHDNCKLADLNNITVNSLNTLIIPTSVNLRYDLNYWYSIGNSLITAQIPYCLYKDILSYNNNTFGNLSSLTITTLDNENPDLMSININNKLTSIVLPEGVKDLSINNSNSNYNVYNSYNNGYYIGTNNNNYYYFISPKSSTSSIVLNNSTKVIASYAFPYSIKEISGGNIESAGSYAFSGCYNMKLNELLVGISYLGNNICYSSNQIDFYIVDGSSYLGNTFNPYYCLAKSSTGEINSNTKYILYDAFSSNTNITNLIIPSSIDETNTSFYNFTNLKSLEIYTKYNYFDLNNVFGCKNLEYIYLNKVNGFNSYGDLSQYQLNNLKYIYYQGSYNDFYYDGLSNEIKNILYFYSEKYPTDSKHKYFHIVNGNYVIW